MSDHITVKDDAYHDTNKTDTSKLNHQLSPGESRLIGILREGGAKLTPGILPEFQLVPQSNNFQSPGSKQQEPPDGYPRPTAPLDRCPAPTAPHHFDPLDPGDGPDGKFYPRHEPSNPGDGRNGQYPRNAPLHPRVGDGDDPGYWNRDPFKPLGRKPDMPKIQPDQGVNK